MASRLFTLELLYDAGQRAAGLSGDCPARAGGARGHWVGGKMRGVFGKIGRKTLVRNKVQRPGFRVHQKHPTTVNVFALKDDLQ